MPEKKLEQSLKIKLCLAKVNSLVVKPYLYLKPKQIECMYVAVEKDLLCVLPTGYGKSLLFNTIPIYSKLCRQCRTTTIAIVISPLNAIIAQQKFLLSCNLEYRSECFPHATHTVTVNFNGVSRIGDGLSISHHYIHRFTIIHTRQNTLNKSELRLQVSSKACCNQSPFLINTLLTST